METTGGYVLNGNSVRPLGPGSSFPQRPESSKANRRRRFGCLGLFLVPLLIGAAIFVIAQLSSASGRSIEAAPTSDIVRIGGEDVAIVIYDDHLRPGLFEPMFQMRAAAIRLSDGALLWDQRVNEELIDDVTVLTASDGYVYLASGDGLVILDAADGSPVARGAGISGLGSDAVMSPSAYGYDRETDAVVLLSGTGRILQMAAGTTEAVAAEGAVASRWRDTLGTGTYYDTSELVGWVDAAVAADGTTFTVVSVNEAVQRDVLEIVSPDGRDILRTEFVDLEILPVTQAGPGSTDSVESGPPPLPAGSAQRYVLVQHRESVNSETVLISSVEVATGRIRSTIEAQTVIERALTGPGGATAVLAATPEDRQVNGLVVLGDDGSLTRVAIGDLPWWLGVFR